MKSGLHRKKQNLEAFQDCSANKLTGLLFNYSFCPFQYLHYLPYLQAMKQMQTTDAMAIMRKMRFDEYSHFTLHHLTHNQHSGESGRLRVVKKCRLRKSLPSDIMANDSNLYLPYVDLETNKPGMCYKCLIRAVAFAPKYELIKTNWTVQ